jgi:hypothetical protein
MFHFVSQLQCLMKYAYIVISHQKRYFVKHHSDSTHKYSEVEIKKMLGFLIDNIYVVVGGQVFKQSVGIPMGTNCSPLLAELFLYSSIREEKVTCCGLQFDISIYRRRFIY